MCQSVSKKIILVSLFSENNSNVPPSKDEGPSNTGNNMSLVLDTRKSNFVNQQWLQFHIWVIMTLLQNGTDIITKFDCYFITKCDRTLLKIA